MSEIYNVYCDESGHLEHDQVNVMVLGAVWCPLEKTREISERIREIKVEYGLSRDFEIKWTKVSLGQLPFYMALMNYFFDDDDLHFRALIVPDKSLLRHDDFMQTHDEFYYKMYFDMLKIIVNPQFEYRIYLDIKDTRGRKKVRKLHEVLSNAKYDFARSIVHWIQITRSHEVDLLQLADLLIGVVSYVNRGNTASRAKLELVERMRHRSRYSLIASTLPSEQKVNIFRWHPRENW